MKRFIVATVTAFTLLTSIYAAESQPKQITELDIQAIQALTSELRSVFQGNTAIQNILEHDFQQVSELYERRLDEKTFAAEVAHIANQTAEKILQHGQHGIDIEKLRTFVENPVVGQFVGVLINRYQQLTIPSNRKSIFGDETARTYFYVSLNALISLAVLACFVSLFIQSVNERCHKICDGFYPPESCPCYGLTPFSRPTEKCARLFLNSLNKI